MRYFLWRLSILLPEIIIIIPLFRILLHFYFHFSCEIPKHLLHIFIFAFSNIFFWSTREKMIMKTALFHREYKGYRHPKFHGQNEWPHRELGVAAKKLAG